MTKWEAGSELEDVNIKINTVLDLMEILFDEMEDEMTIMHRTNLREYGNRQAPLLSLLSVATEKLETVKSFIASLSETLYKEGKQEEV